MPRQAVVDRCASLTQQAASDRMLAFPPELRVFVAEYCVDLNLERAAAVAGVRPDVINRSASVAESVEHTLAVREANSELKAEYVRQYVKDILDLCPVDHFVFAPDGGWMIDPVDFQKLPFRVKRLVESVEMRVYRNCPIFAVKFVSKAFALALAARLCVAENDNRPETLIPWDKVVVKASIGMADPVEAKLKELEEGLPTGVPACPEVLKPFSENGAK